MSITCDTLMCRTRAPSHIQSENTAVYTYKGTKNENDQFVNQVFKQQHCNTWSSSIHWHLAE